MPAPAIRASTCFAGASLVASVALAIAFFIPFSIDPEGLAYDPASDKPILSPTTIVLAEDQSSDRLYPGFLAPAIVAVAIVAIPSALARFWLSLVPLPLLAYTAPFTSLIAGGGLSGPRSEPLVGSYIYYVAVAALVLLPVAHLVAARHEHDAGLRAA